MVTLRKVTAAERHRWRRARRVRVGRPDGQLTSAAGLEAVRELDRVLGVTTALTTGIGAVKERRRGLGGGELVMAMASCQLTGGDFLVSLDRRRADVAGQLLEPVPTPAATTAAGVAKRFTATHLRGIEAGDRDGEHDDGGAGPGGAPVGVVEGRHDRWGRDRCGGLRPLQLPFRRSTDRYLPNYSGVVRAA